MKAKIAATIVLILISLTNFTIVTQGQTDLSIWQAASTGDVAVVEEYLAKGADINAKDNVYGVTPLSWATLLGQTQMAELLIQRGANVNSKNRDGATSLHAAAFLGQHKIATLLVQKGANTNVRNNSGERPTDSLQVDWAATQFIVQLLQIQVDREKVETGRAKVAKLLSQQGAPTGFAGPVVLGGVDNVPPVLPIVWVRVVFRVKGIEVDLAKRASSPPSRLQCLHEGRDVGIELVAIGEQTVAAASQPRGNARPGRTADRVVGEGIGEGHTHALEASQVRQVADAVHGRFQPLGPHLIDHEEDDVGLVS